MATTIRASEGDLLDSLCLARYGRLDQGMVETVLDANPGLSAIAQPYASGVRIIFPDDLLDATTAMSAPVRLWT